MADRKIYRLEKSQKGKWEVWRDGAKRPSSSHPTKAEAQLRMRGFLEPQSKSSAALPLSAARKPAVSSVLKNLEYLSQEDLLQVAQKVESLSRIKKSPPPPPLKSLFGVIKTEIKAPSVVEIRKLRKEMWQNFPREMPGQ